MGLHNLIQSIYAAVLILILKKIETQTASQGVTTFQIGLKIEQTHWQTTQDDLFDILHLYFLWFD